MDTRGTDTAVTANNLHTFDTAKPTGLGLTAGGAVISANVLENTVIEVDDQTGANLPIHLQANVFRNSQIVHRTGHPIKTSGQPEKE